MSYRSLMAWLEEFDPHGCAPEILEPVVQLALEDLEAREDSTQNVEVCARLTAICERLQRSESVGDELDSLFADFPQLSETPLEALESEYRAVAEGLPEWEWRTETFERFAQCVDAYRSSQTVRGQELLRPLEETMNNAWRTYSQTLVHADEVTAEAVAGHRLLQQGTLGWLQSFTLLREGNHDDAVAFAEAANRQLVALQKFASSIEKQGRSLV